LEKNGKERKKEARGGYLHERFQRNGIGAVVVVVIVRTAHGEPNQTS
jgi:hypothetical protein